MRNSQLFSIAIFILSIAQPVGAADTPIDANTVQYFNANGVAVSGYLVEPAGEKHNLPAIILIHEWWGLNDDIRAKARDFAQAGYVALAVDLYQGQHTTDRSRAGQLAGQVRNDMDTAFDNLRAAINTLTNNAKVDRARLASVGWCFGGGWSYQLAKNDLGVAASVIYYGRFNPADDLSKMRAEILGHFADKDAVINVDNVYELQAKLKTLKGEHEIYIYPNTTHGFASRPGANAGYDEAAATQAQQRTLDFLRKHL